MMPRVLQYAIYASPSWATPAVPFALVEWVLDIDLGKGQPSPGKGYPTLAAARGGIPDLHERVKVDRQRDDEPDLVEVWV